MPTVKNGKICYIEIPAIDIARSAAFYANVFGWGIRRRGDVGEDRIERFLDPEQRHRQDEEYHVEEQDHVADPEQMAALADQQRRDLGAVEDGAATHRQPDPRAEKEAAEDGGEQPVGGHVRDVDQRQRHRQPEDAGSTAHREGGANLPVTERDEGQIDDRDPDRE